MPDMEIGQQDETLVWRSRLCHADNNSNQLKTLTRRSFFVEAWLFRVFSVLVLV